MTLSTGVMITKGEVGCQVLLSLGVYVDSIPLFTVGTFYLHHSPDDGLVAQETTAPRAVHFLCLHHVLGSGVVSYYVPPPHLHVIIALIIAISTLLILLAKSISIFSAMQRESRCTSFSHDWGLR